MKLVFNVIKYAHKTKFDTVEMSCIVGMSAICVCFNEQRFSEKTASEHFINEVNFYRIFIQDVR